MHAEREVLETMRLESYRRERWWSTNYASSRELFWFSGVVLRLVYSCLSSCCSRAQQNGQRNQTDFGLLYPPSHARAAAPPSVRSFFCGEVPFRSTGRACCLGCMRDPVCRCDGWTRRE